MKVEKRIRFVPSRAVGVSRQIASGARREGTAGPKHTRASVDCGDLLNLVRVKARYG